MLAAIALAALVTAIPDSAVTFAPFQYVGPDPAEGYCIGVSSDVCPYSWSVNNGRWYFNPAPPDEESDYADAHRRRDVSLEPDRHHARDEDAKPKPPRLGD